MVTLSSQIVVPLLNTRTKNIVLAFLGSIVIAAFAQIRILIPISPVPITGQTFAVLSVGMVLGPGYGSLSLLMYLLQGVIGIPVFTGFGSGFSVLLGSSGGYLFGFVGAACIIGFLSQKGWDRSVIKTFMAMLIGNIVLYIPGLLQLGFVVGWDKPILAWGLTPFIIGDLIKMGSAAVLFPVLWKKIRK